MHAGTFIPASGQQQPQPQQQSSQPDMKRKRLTQACDMCRKKKIKCDGGKPTCANCVKLKRECTYIPSNKKRGPRQGYIEMLEKRLDKMEKLLTNPNAEQNGHSTSSASSATSPSDNTTHPSQQHQHNLPSLNANASSESDLGQLNVHQPHPNMLMPTPLAMGASPNDTGLRTSNSHHFPSALHSKSEQQQQATQQSSISQQQSQQSPVLQRISHERSGSTSDHAPPAPQSSTSSSSTTTTPTSGIAPPLANNNATSSSFTDTGTVDTSTALLPPRPIVEHLIKLFFDKIYPSTPIFDPRTFLRHYRENKHSEFLLLCVLSVASRFSDDPNVKEEPAWNSGEKFAAKARALLINAVDDPSLSNVQAITLLALHEFGSARGPRSWMYSGMAIRMAMELGLNKEPEVDQSTEQNQPADRWMEQEVRRRVFWVVFTIDNLVSASTGRPSVIKVEDCDVLLPSDEYGWIRGQFYTETMDGSRVAQFNVGELRDSSLLGISSLVSPSSRLSASTTSSKSSNSTLSCHAYLLRANALLGRIATFVNRTTRERILPPCNPDSEFAKLDRSIDEWYDQLPSAMKYTQENMDRHRMSPNVDSSRFVLAHIMHNTLTVLLHRPSLVLFDTLNSEVVQPPLKEFCRASVEKCLHAVDNVTTMLKAINSCVDLMPPFLTYLSYTVATIVVNNTFSSKPDEAKKARSDLNEHFRLLQSMRKYWAMADKLYFMIRDLYAMHSNTLRQNYSNASSASNSSGGSLVEGTSPRSVTSPSLASPTPWNSSSNSSLISPVSTVPPSTSSSSSLSQQQFSPTLCGLKSENNNAPIDGSFVPTNNFYSNAIPTSTFANYDPSMRKMSLAELALSTCDGASCTNWTVGDNRENVAAALQSLMGRTNSGPVMNQPMFDLNSTASVPVSNPSVDALAFNLGFSNLDPYNPSSTT